MAVRAAFRTHPGFCPIRRGRPDGSVAYRGACDRTAVHGAVVMRVGAGALH